MCDALYTDTAKNRNAGAPAVRFWLGKGICILVGARGVCRKVSTGEEMFAVHGLSWNLRYGSDRAQLHMLKQVHFALNDKTPDSVVYALMMVVDMFIASGIKYMVPTETETKDALPVVAEATVAA